MQAIFNSRRTIEGIGLFLAFGLFLLVPSAHSQIERVGTASANGESGSATTIAVTRNSVGAGNTLVALVTVEADVTISVADNQSGNWQQAAARSVGIGSVQMFYAANHPGGNTTITATFGSSVPFRGIIVVEISGLGASPTVEAPSPNTNSGSSNSPSTVSLTPSGNDAYVFAGLFHFDNNITAVSSGWTLEGESGAGSSLAGIIVTGGGAQSNTFTMSTSASWMTQIAALLPTGATPSWAFVANRGTAQNKTSGGTLNLTPTATLAAGRVAIVRASSDNDSTATSSGQTTRHSVSDSAGNTWVKIREHTFSAGAAADGVTHSLWYSVLTTQLTTSSTVTLTLGSNVTAKAMALAEFSVPSGNTVSLAGQNGAQGTGTNNVTVTVSSLASKQYLFLGSVGTEGPDGDTFTQDSDYQNLASIGTTGGGATSNVSLRGGYRIATLTGDTYNPTLGTSRDWVDILGVLLSESAGPPPEGRRRASITISEAGGHPRPGTTVAD
jgi:hypothetical protein